MRTLQRYIEAKGCQLARHPLFSRFEHLESAAHLNALASSLTFWAMSYPDLLRLNEDRMEDPAARKLARSHCAEEAQHEHWFLEDLKVLGAGVPELRWAFGPGHTPARDASHALVAEVYRAQGDAERLALLLVCEAAGRIFFERVSGHLRRLGLAPGLKYLAGAHPEAGRVHALSGARLDELLGSFNLSATVRASAFALVDRAFAAFGLLLDGMDVALVRAGATRAAALMSGGPSASAA